MRRSRLSRALRSRSRRPFIRAVIAPFVQRVLHDAERVGAAAVILEINTFGGRVDAAMPVQAGAPGAASAPVEEKTVSYVRKEFRATAESRDRPLLIAEATVDADVEIEGLIEKGKLLTLTCGWLAGANRNVGLGEVIVSKQQHHELEHHESCGRDQPTRVLVNSGDKSLRRWLLRHDRKHYGGVNDHRSARRTANGSGCGYGCKMVRVSVYLSLC